MHIPDGFLDPKTSLATAAIALAGVSYSLVRLRKTLSARQVPMIGLAAAFIFAAQMLNFPVMGGTSGHLIGAALAAVLFGVHGAVLVMTAVLLLQCFLFADGGVTALGANILNMGIVAVYVGYFMYSLVQKITGESLRNRLLATGLAAWCSTVAGAFFCSGQLAFSGSAPAGLVFPAMTTIHILIGVGECVITTLVVYSLSKTRPELFAASKETTHSAAEWSFVGYGIAVSLGLAVFLAPLASASPDGLERVAGLLGFEQLAHETPLVASPLPDYAIPGLTSPIAATILAGVIGLLATFAVAFLLARSLAARAPDRL
ncbi:MAG: energy-coupling factor ABC transporter permease [bacterium]|nr:energy-coupling factor ABC transporter permease [bacterium]